MVFDVPRSNACCFLLVEDLHSVNQCVTSDMFAEEAEGTCILRWSLCLVGIAVPASQVSDMLQGTQRHCRILQQCSNSDFARRYKKGLPAAGPLMPNGLHWLSSESGHGPGLMMV